MLYLLEIDPYDPGIGAVRTLRFGSAGFVTALGDDPPNAVFAARISDPGHYERHLFGSGRTRGESDIAAGEIKLVNPDGALDFLLDLAFDGRALRLVALPDAGAPWAGRAVVLAGTMEQVEFAGRSASIVLRDRLALIDETLQGSTYLGTTTSGTATVAEGNADLKDVKKPELFGRCLSVTPVLVDQFNHVWQISARALSAVTAVRDRGVLLTPTQDYPTLAALKAATLTGGQYATCLALGLIRLASRPAGALTVDANEGATAADRSAARIVQRMLANRPGVVLDADDVAALHAANPAECGLWCSTQEVTIRAAASTVLASVGASIGNDRFGVFRVKRLELPTGAGVARFGPEVILDRGEALARLGTSDDGEGVAARSVTVQYARAYTVFDEADLASVNTADAFRSFGVQEWRQETATSAANAVIHPKGPELVFETCLVNKADAAAEAARLLALYGSRRDLFRVAVPSAKAATVDLGDVVTLASPRFGLSAGRPMRVLGVTPRFANNTTDVELWG